MKNMIRPSVFLAVFLAISAVYVLSLTTQTLTINTLYLIFPIVTTLIGLYSSSIYGFKSSNGRALILINGGLVCMLIAESIWYVSDNFTSSGGIIPSWADVFFLLSYPFFGAGVYQGFIAAEIKFKNVKKSLLYLALLASLILTILVVYFDIYKAYDSTVELLVNITNMGYGVVDLVLVVSSLFTILVASEYKGGKLASFWGAMALGFLFNLIADILSAMYEGPYLEGLKPYGYIDLFWIAAYLFLAYGMLENYLHITAVQRNVRLKIQQRR